MIYSYKFGCDLGFLEFEECVLYILFSLGKQFLVEYYIYVCVDDYFWFEVFFYGV